jgi:hypothetical protein
MQVDLPHTPASVRTVTLLAPLAAALKAHLDELVAEDAELLVFTTVSGRIASVEPELDLPARARRCGGAAGDRFGRVECGGDLTERARVAAYCLTGQRGLAGRSVATKQAFAPPGHAGGIPDAGLDRG